MIDFRYHIVSIVAVFLALALGLVLGTTTIDPLLVNDLKDRVTQLVNDKSGLQADVESLRDQTTDADKFVRAATGPLVRDQLTGRSVVVLSLAGVPAGMRDDMLSVLDKAGARVSALVTLTDRYADPTELAVFDRTVAAATPPDVVLSGTSSSQRASELLATVLTVSAVPVLPTGSASSGPTPSASRSARATNSAAASGSASPSASPSAILTPSAAPPSTTVSVLEMYRDAGLLTIDADTPTPADLVLILTPDGPPGGQLPVTVDINRYLDLVGALVGVRHATVVAAGPTSSVVGGVITHVRGSGIANLVSTVDGAETPYGLIATVRALRAQLFGTVGKYGGATDDLPMPEAVDGQ
ncbi:MAG: hypothetical protein JWM93_10 [Frankiales bacterium]|nr:hypothetical protein [Frankiales bacterium]